jgi:hypothetical protein
MAEAAVQFSVTLVTIECGGCAMVFAVPRGFYDDCRNEGQSFRCPNPKCKWPSQSYTESTVQRLEKQLAAEKRRAEYAVTARKWAEEQRDHAEARRRAAKGQVTKMKNRAAAGLCPCCRRHFENHERHMASKHPGFAVAGEASP